MTSIDQKKVARLRVALVGIWPHPTTFDSWAFLVTEVSEIGDALLRSGYGGNSYKRNHEKEVDIPSELADAYLMLITLANDLEVDLGLELDKCVSKFYLKYKDEIDDQLRP